MKRLQHEPFALVGVNSDKTPQVYQEAVQENQLTWRSFFDGGGTGGPIATQWGVTGWPTIYVLDHLGVIRHKGVRGEALDQAIDDLLQEIKAAE